MCDIQSHNGFVTMRHRVRYMEIVFFFVKDFEHSEWNKIFQLNISFERSERTFTEWNFNRFWYILFNLLISEEKIMKQLVHFGINWYKHVVRPNDKVRVNIIGKALMRMPNICYSSNLTVLQRIERLWQYFIFSSLFPHTFTCRNCTHNRTLNHSFANNVLKLTHWSLCLVCICLLLS